MLANLSARGALEAESRLSIANEAVTIGPRWAGHKPEPQKLKLVGALENLAFVLEAHQRRDEAIAVSREAVTMRRRPPKPTPATSPAPWAPSAVG